MQVTSRLLEPIRIPFSSVSAKEEERFGVIPPLKPQGMTQEGTLFFKDPLDTFMLL
jgi:hypothetical protein